MDRREILAERPVERGRGFTRIENLPASTLIVVKALFHPDFLIEVEGVATV